MPLVDYEASMHQRRTCWALIAGLILASISIRLLAGADPSLSAEKLPSLTEAGARPHGDWLVSGSGSNAGVYQGAGGKELVLDNGLIRRTFRLDPNCATVGFDNLMTGASVIRAVKPEGIVRIDGRDFAVGGLKGQPEHAYLLPEWVALLTNNPAAFQFTGFETGRTQAPFPWKRARHAADLPWPAPGVSVVFHFMAPAHELAGVRLEVHYELYDGLPLMAKWMTIKNGGGRTIRLDSFTGEMLAVVEAESAVDERATNSWRLPALTVASDYSFHGMDASTASRTTEWLSDPEYTSQVNYMLRTPAVVVSRPPIGPSIDLKPGEQFKTFRTFVLAHDSDSRERQGLGIRRMYRALAPWTTENPIMMHVRSAQTKAFRLGVDQCAEVGFEMIIYTFGSGLNMENEDPVYRARIKEDVDYAHRRGIQVGAYSLLASRRINDETDVINPATGKTGGAIFGESPCVGSRWGQDYFRKIRSFMEQTGLDLLEHDGSYPGDLCASTHHPGHRGLEDSQWRQWETIAHFYEECRGRGIYLNVPDFYFLNGSSKTGMGYRESNWSLPRERQIILGRQNIFDGTWAKGPSMGWMFVPLVEYQGGGAAATLEPLHEHLDGYEAHLANNFGAGVQACYRGPRLYDTDATREMVKKWVAWFKEYRDILESDLIHMRRPDGRDIDCFLHVNPKLRRCALAVVYNPLDEPVKRDLILPLYHSGLTKRAFIREQEKPAKEFQLDREYKVVVPVEVPARGRTWLVVERTASLQ